MSAAPDRDRLPAPPGLCGRCVHALLVASPRSVFLRCGLADTDPRYRKYPPLPVERCAGFEPNAAVPGC